MKITLHLMPEEAVYVSEQLRELLELKRGQATYTSEQQARALDYVAGALAHNAALKGVVSQKPPRALRRNRKDGE